MVAFDTGPGNALLNDWIREHTGSLFDNHGELARKGCVHRELLDSWIKQSNYFSKTPPKSLDRNTFQFVKDSLKQLSVEDGAATLLEFTVEAIKENMQHLPCLPQFWFVCGGGRKNTYLMERLQNSLSPTIVDSVETIGWDGDMVEAEGMAFLAARCLKRMPISFPSTTSCSSPSIGGSIHYYN